uniref:Sarcolemmal membrane-associated protein n=1 Tax=Hirondellea gigas TaxID=1518452 RepID=A0A6A7G4F9_9CRUS
MVNVVGVGVGGSGQQQQQQRGVLSLSDFILSAPLVVPPATSVGGQQTHTVDQLQLEQLELQKQDINSSSHDSPSNAPSKMTARATLQCRPNSHPFHERSLLLESSVKIGRSVARSRPGVDNSIFDCKVLSRNHALLWYEDGKFYLQDTKSSNGTFVNNQRLSKGSEESAPREVCSGDIVQFGVDVMENSRKVTHGCIIATMRLFMPDGQEAKASPSLSVTGLPSEAGVEVQQLKTCLQEAHYREAAIQTKLQALATIIQATQDAANQSWAAMIGEDRLLQKLEMMEAQLATYSKNWPEDRLREDVRRLLEEKCQYESHVKESLARMLNQKCQALTRLADAERSLAGSESELSQIRIVAESTQQQLTELLEQQAAQTQHVTSIQQQLQVAEQQLKECSESGGGGGGGKATDRDDDGTQQLQKLRDELATSCAKEEQLLAQMESATADADFSKQQLSALQARYATQNQQSNPDAQDDRESNSVVSSGVVAGEQRLQSARLKQYQLELRNGQTQLAALQKDVTAAEKAEERVMEEKRRLEEELNDARCQAESSNTLLHHLHHTITTLHNMLHTVTQHHTSSTGVMPDLVAENNSNNVNKSVLLITDENNSNFVRSSTELTDSPVKDIVSNNNVINAAISADVGNAGDDTINDANCDTAATDLKPAEEQDKEEKPDGNKLDTSTGVDDNKEMNDVNGTSPDPTPKIYDDLYEDFTATMTRKKDPLAEDDNSLSKKDEEPETKKEQGDEEAEEDEDVDSLSTDTTFTIVDTVQGSGVEKSTGQQSNRCRSTDAAHSAVLCLDRLTDHLHRLQELRESTGKKDIIAEGVVAALREQLQQATFATLNAAHETRALKTSLSSAESYAAARAAVVTELQQSTARLGAAGSIIKHQLQQLNTELLQQRQLVLQERSNGHSLLERLQEAEALAAEGVEQTEVLNKQLQLLKLRANLEAARVNKHIHVSGNKSMNHVKGNDGKNYVTGNDSKNDVTGNDCKNVMCNDIKNDVTSNDSKNDVTCNDNKNDVAGNDIKNDVTGSDIKNDVTGNDIKNDVTGNKSENAPTRNNDSEIDITKSNDSEKDVISINHVTNNDTGDTSQCSSSEDSVKQSVSESEAINSSEDVTRVDANKVNIDARDSVEPKKASEAEPEKPSEVQVASVSVSKIPTDYNTEAVELTSAAMVRSEEFELETVKLKTEVHELQLQVQQLAETKKTLLQQAVSQDLQKRDSGYCEESTGSAVSTPTLAEAPPSPAGGSDGKSRSSSDVEQELLAVRRHCEELKLRLATRDQDFTLLSLQNKTQQESSLRPWWTALLLALLFNWLYHCFT